MYNLELKIIFKIKYKFKYKINVRLISSIRIEKNPGSITYMCEIQIIIEKFT